MASKKTKAPDAGAVQTPTINMQLLAALVAGNSNAQGYILVSKTDSDPLVNAGLAEVNAAIATADGLATRATAKGIELNTQQPQTGAAPAAAATSAPAFTLVSGVPIPESSRKSVSREEAYPFSKMEVGQSFFIASTEKKPQPERSYASTVASASARFASDHPTEKRKNRKGVEVATKVFERQFVIRAVPDGAAYGQPGVKGAAVWRQK